MLASTQEELEQQQQELRSKHEQEEQAGEELEQLRLEMANLEATVVRQRQEAQEQEEELGEAQARLLEQEQRLEDSQAVLKDLAAARAALEAQEAGAAAAARAALDTKARLVGVEAALTSWQQQGEEAEVQLRRGQEEVGCLRTDLEEARSVAKVVGRRLQEAEAGGQELVARLQVAWQRGMEQEEVVATLEQELGVVRQGTREVLLALENAEAEVAAARVALGVRGQELWVATEQREQLEMKVANMTATLTRMEAEAEQKKALAENDALKVKEGEAKSSRDDEVGQLKQQVQELEQKVQSRRSNSALTVMSKLSATLLCLEETIGAAKEQEMDFTMAGNQTYQTCNQTLGNQTLGGVPCEVVMEIKAQLLALQEQLVEQQPEVEVEELRRENKELRGRLEVEVRVSLWRHLSKPESDLHRKIFLRRSRRPPELIGRGWGRPGRPGE